MKRISYDNSPRIAPAAWWALKLAAVPLILLAMAVAWRLYDLSAGGGDDKAAGTAAAFFITLLVVMTAVPASLPLALYLRCRQGVVFDHRTREISLWKGGLLVPFNIHYYDFADVRRLLFSPSVEVAGLNVDVAFKVSAVLPGGGTVTLVRHPDRETALSRGREISGLLGLALEEKASGAVEPDPGMAKEIEKVRRIVKRHKRGIERLE